MKPRLWIVPILCLGLLAPFSVSAQVTTRTVTYDHDGTKLVGYLALPEAQPRGAVLVIHEWWGLNDYARRRARMLADLGYAAFALDMYGEGKTTDQVEQAGQWSGDIYADRALARHRAAAGLDAFKTAADLGDTPVAAIGYCFGGTTVLELAYSGADLAGAVSFHGNPKPPAPDDAITAAILLCHGDADPLVKNNDLNATLAALSAANADWTLIRYAGALHAFSNPKADTYGLPPVAYQAKADHRSWDHMQVFLHEVFALTPPEVSPAPPEVFPRTTERQ